MKSFSLALSPGKLLDALQQMPAVGHFRLTHVRRERASQ
jgi:hypothetical protein